MLTAVSGPSRRPYQPGLILSLQGWLAVCMGVMTVALVAIALRGPGDPTDAKALSQRIVAALLVLLFMGGMTVVLWAGSRVGILVNDRQVEVREIVKERRYSWDEVSGFDFVPLRETRSGISQRITGKKVQSIRLLLTDGSTIVTLVNSSLTAGGDPPAEVVRLLEAARPA